MVYPGSPYNTIIGTVTVPEGVTMHQAHFETAAWWQDVALDAGTYEVRSNGYYVAVTVPGTIVASYFPSLYGGVPIDGTRSGRDDKVGQRSSHHFLPYAYDVAKSLFHHPTTLFGWPFEMAEGITAERHRRYSAIFDAEFTTHSLHVA
jgi:hypothetical protein